MTTSLHELFPSLDQEAIADVLRQCSNDVEQAADMLLGMSLDSARPVKRRGIIPCL